MLGEQAQAPFLPLPLCHHPRPVFETRHCYRLLSSGCWGTKSSDRAGLVEVSRGHTTTFSLLHLVVSFMLWQPAEPGAGMLIHGKQTVTRVAQGGG